MTSNPLPSSQQKLLDNPKALCNIVRRVALEAGAIILKHFESIDICDLQYKEDGSPVTIADKEAESHIQKALSDVLPSIPLIGEETHQLDSSGDMSAEGYFWLVDPLDGTREFVEGGEEFTVNIALVHKHSPILGVVYAPALGTLYAGCTGEISLRWNQDTGKEKPIHVRTPPHQGVTVLTSKGYQKLKKMDHFLEQFKIKKILKKSSSIKICLLAEGKADLYPRFGPTYEWDTAAGDAILRAAGGMVTDLSGHPLRYGLGGKKCLNPEFVASSFPWFEQY